MLRSSASIAGGVLLQSVLRWCRRLALLAIGLLVGASALLLSMLLLAYASARAVLRSLLGRAPRRAGDLRSERVAPRAGVRIPPRGEVVDVEARPLT